MPDSFHRDRRDPGARIAVVLVNWNGASDTLATLASLDQVVGAEALRVLVVDNGSTDGSPERLRKERPGLELVETGANLGFAGGNDAGIRKALEAPEVGWVLLLNTDVDVDPGFLAPLVHACADPRSAPRGRRSSTSIPATACGPPAGGCASARPSPSSSAAARPTARAGTGRATSPT